MVDVVRFPVASQSEVPLAFRITAYPDGMVSIEINYERMGRGEGEDVAIALTAKALHQIADGMTR